MSVLEKHSRLFELHSQTQGYKSRLDRSRQVIDKAFKVCRRWYVAFSGGKDSTVVWNLVGKLDAIWSDDEFVLPETEKYIERCENIKRIRINVVHTEWFKVKGNYDSIPDFAQNYEGCFLGLRMQENSMRRIHLGKFGSLFKTNAGIWHCSPIAHWSVRDVWTYIYSNQLDYNRAYDKLSQIGVAIEYQRIGPFATEKALGFGQLAILKRGWPEQYNRFVEKHRIGSSYV